MEGPPRTAPDTGARTGVWAEPPRRSPRTTSRRRTQQGEVGAARRNDEEAQLRQARARERVGRLPAVVKADGRWGGGLSPVGCPPTLRVRSSRARSAQLLSAGPGESRASASPGGNVLSPRYAPTVLIGDSILSFNTELAERCPFACELLETGGGDEEAVLAATAEVADNAPELLAEFVAALEQAAELNDAELPWERDPARFTPAPTRAVAIPPTSPRRSYGRRRGRSRSVRASSKRGPPSRPGDDDPDPLPGRARGRRMSGFGFGADRFGWTDEALAELHRNRGWTEPAIERLELTYDSAQRPGRLPFRSSTRHSTCSGRSRTSPTRHAGTAARR